MNRFNIKNKLLSAAFFGNTECTRIKGYFNCDEIYFGRALVEYFTSRLFSIHRLPGYTPFYENTYFDEYIKKFGGLNEDAFDEAYHEFVELYDFTQKELKDSGLWPDGSLKLYRALHKYETDVILPQLLNNNDFIEFPANIVSSYSHVKLEKGAYNRWMFIERKVPLDIIVMYNECLQFPFEPCRKYNPGGEHEVWVVEKSLYGYSKLQKSNFIYDEIPSEDICRAESIKDQFCYDKIVKPKDGPVFGYNANLILPCRENRFVDCLVSRIADKVNK